MTGTAGDRIEPAPARNGGSHWTEWPVPFIRRPFARSADAPALTAMQAVGAMTGGLATLALVALLVVGSVAGDEARVGEGVAERASASAGRLLAPPTVSAPLIAPATSANAPPAHGQTAIPPRTRTGKRPDPGVLRTYFPCRAPAVFLAHTPPPQCRPPRPRHDPQATTNRQDEAFSL